MNILGIVLGAALVAFSFAVAPIPLTVTLENSARNAVIYPNVLFAIPMILLGVLLILYGATATKQRSSNPVS